MMMVRQAYHDRRNKLKWRTHCQTFALTPRNPQYKKWILQHTAEEVRKDFGCGDITSSAVFDESRKAKAFILAKEKGILAGMQEIKFFIGKFKNIKAQFLKKDGEVLNKREKVLALEGDIFVLMKIERAILNLLGRMSGVATFSHKLVEKVKRIKSSISACPLVTPTRKTLWGLLDKRACILGGCGTHRLSLDNAILIKHNHIKASGMPMIQVLEKAIKNARKVKAKFVEVEVKSVGDAIKAAEFFDESVKKKRLSLPCFVMFDNMKPREIAEALAAIKKNKTYSNVLFEASGRINMSNIVAYAKTGVDVISCGAVTHSAPMLDFSMRVVRQAHHDN